jgi:hypothetical protein
MKGVVISIFLMMIAVPVYASTWCKWENSTPVNCTRDRSGTLRVDDMALSGGEAQFNSKGYYKKVTVRPILEQGNRYTDINYTFDGSIITATYTQGPDPNKTIPALKIQKYQDMKAQADKIKTEDCSYNGFTIPQKTRTLMVEAISANKTMTYEAINESTGFYQGLERTPAQAQIVLDACLDTFEAANQRLYVDHPDTTGDNTDGLVPQIKACVDRECIDNITWDYSLEPSGTN